MIGLFKPTEVNDAGYRLYDDKAIDKLGQILLFKELDLPLTDIRLIMENPDLDSRSVLANMILSQSSSIRLKIPKHYCWI